MTQPDPHGRASTDPAAGAASDEDARIVEAVAAVTGTPPDVAVLLAAHEEELAALRDAVATLSHAVLRLENDVTALRAERGTHRGS